MSVSSSHILRVARKRPVIVVSSAQFIRVLARSQIWIFVPIYLTEIRHIPVYFMGVLFFLTAVIALPFSVYGGNLIDRIGRRRVAVLIPFLVSILLFLTSISIMLRMQAIYIIIEFLSIEPLSVVQWIADSVIMADVTSEDERLDGFGILRIAGNIGFSVGPAIGGFIAQYSYAYIFLASAIGALIEFILYFAWITETGVYSRTNRKISIPFNDRAFMLVASLIGLSYFVSGQWGTTLTLFLSIVDKITNSSVGILYSINGITVVLLQIPIIRLIRKMDGFQQLAIGSIVYASGFFALAFFSSFWIIALDVVVLTIGENIVSPVSNSIVAKLAPPDKRGEYYGAMSLFVGFISPIAPVLGTSLLYRYESNSLFLWGPVFLIGIIVAIATLMIGSKLNKASNTSYITKSN
ncbi:MFS transporter [Thermoplasma volcanium]|uniref:MFS transporter n=1 Tax=Thermoplasma volcanium TaxID=50339 RepID=UPI0000164D43|nr:MFS transporter [Thermoplasma volcanium]